MYLIEYKVVLEETVLNILCICKNVEKEKQYITQTDKIFCTPRRRIRFLEKYFFCLSRVFATCAKYRLAVFMACTIAHHGKTPSMEC